MSHFLRVNIFFFLFLFLIGCSTKENKPEPGSNPRYSGWEREPWIEAKASVITLESSYASILHDVLSRPAETGPFYFEPLGLLELRVFIDKSIVEVFANGRQCVVMRVYPGLKESLGVSLRSLGQKSKLISLDAWHMKNIYI